MCLLGCSEEPAEAPFRQDGAAARPAFCERADVRKRKTAIDAVFCGELGANAISSVRDVQTQLELVPFAQTKGGDGAKHVNEAVMLGLSTALPGHFVSPINPRAIILGRENTMAFVRGAQEVELVSRTRDGSDRLVFYLLRYRQACNDADAGCSFGDLYTPATESNWTAIQLHDDTELENTPFDCRACHARASEHVSLLMREVDGPWTHFFDTLSNAGNDRPERSGYDLLQDYLAAKGGELYAEIDATRMTPSTAQALEISVGLDQPVYFDSLVIERERWPYRDGGYPAEPKNSPTWDAAYAAFKRGEQLALPHFDPRSTSPEKQARLSEAYTRFRNGELDMAELPDLADIFPDEPVTRAQIGLEVEPDASASEVLIQACGPCHNNALNPHISRASFSIDLARMDKQEIDAAIERIELPPTAAGAMPPQRARALTPSVRARLLDYLRGHSGVDPQLTQAAESAMLGGSRPRR
ncbi:MAG TPA: hypothetical protein VFN67_41270 [Polyangiales bacterium]|nr:hypothetical protein [Polyangiales bacterium]